MIDPQLTEAAMSHLFTGGEDVGFTEELPEGLPPVDTTIESL
jgi:hypothetical protein